MTTAARFVAGSTLTNAAVTYYTTPANTTAIIKNATACNTSASPVKLTVTIGGTGVPQTIISARTIGPGATDSLPELVNQVLPAGTIISAKDDTGAVTGFEVSGVTIP